MPMVMLTCPSPLLPFLGNAQREILLVQTLAQPSLLGQLPTSFYYSMALKFSYFFQCGLFPSSTA